MAYAQEEINMVLKERSIALGAAMALVMKSTNADEMKYSTELFGTRDDNKGERYEVKVVVTKKKCYGLGIPPKDSQAYKDMEKLQERYSKLSVKALEV